MGESIGNAVECMKERPLSLALMTMLTAKQIRCVWTCVCLCVSSKTES